MFRPPGAASFGVPAPRPVPGQAARTHGVCAARPGWTARGSRCVTLRRGPDRAASCGPRLSDLDSPPPVAGLERPGGRLGWTPAFEGNQQHVVRFTHRITYGPGYRRARADSFRRSRGICQSVRAATRPGGPSLCATHSHDGAVTAADLTALCRPCHWTATLVRVLERAGGAGVWLVLTGGARPASVRKRVARRRPRDCRRRSGRCLRCRRRWISGWSCGCWRSGAGCG